MVSGALYSLSGLCIMSVGALYNVSTALSNIPGLCIVF